MNCSSHFVQSYTGLEYNLDPLHKVAGPYLELGRACIKKEFRKGSVISYCGSLGIAEYMNLSSAKVFIWLFKFKNIQCA